MPITEPGLVSSKELKDMERELEVGLSMLRTCNEEAVEYLRRGKQDSGFYDSFRCSLTNYIAILYFEVW